MFYKAIIAFALSFSFLSAQAATSDPDDWSPSGWLTPSYGLYQYIPSTALKAGKHAHYDAYICQAEFIGGLKLPGKILDIRDGNAEKKCWVSYRGQQIGATTYKVLDGSKRYLFWFKYPKGLASNQAYFPGAVVVGGQEGIQTYICKGKYYSATVIGKYVPGHGCYFAHDGKEHLYSIYSTDFEVLLTSF